MSGRRTDALGEPRNRVVQLADRMREDIGAMQCTSTPLGRQRDLLKRYGVGLATLRGAIRTLEQDGTASMRPGFHGGLYSTAINIPLAARLIADHLIIRECSIAQASEAAQLFYRLAIPMAVARAGTANHQAISGMLAAALDHPASLSAWFRFRHTVVTAARDPAISLFHCGFHLAFTETLCAESSSAREHLEPLARIFAQHESALASAILDRDPDAAMRALEPCLALETAYVARTVRRGIIPATLVPKTLYGQKVLDKLAHQTLRAVRQDIQSQTIGSQARLGRISDLATRYGVSVDVMREALQIALSHGLVELRRGRLGGVFIAPRDDRHVVKQSCDYLRTHADDAALRQSIDAVVGSVAGENVLRDFALSILRTAVKAQKGAFAGGGEMDWYCPA